ncbi:hypothetical protein H2O64_12345 [Kordia sp. YSTF-M3]|uniref:WG repeat-containing protein n=1 Tax=Kordia aestuariivivens TaxID=2759037 RepID=A0ABR7QAF2_9FLAO|nr:hypothetical protein [Kordia aestuariivivens]MBC8755458.1 hypothetical protein [Kordia aestuariivivens]
MLLENRKKEITANHYAYVITELTNGTLNLFDLRKPNTNLLEHVDEITQVGNCIRFKKDNLYGYYGMHTKVHFKKLDQFQGFYARFELPNGKRGWLDRNGKEYLNL